MKKILKFQLFAFILISNLHAVDHYKGLSDFLFERIDEGIITEQFLLYHDGAVHFKRFEKGDEKTRHLLWSMTKSISSLVFGIAEDRGFISRDDLLSKYFPKEIAELNKKERTFFNSLKIKNFLEMSSGIYWNEFYDKSPFNSHVVRMLYFATKKSSAQYVLQQIKRHEPGRKFNYSSGDTNVVMAALQRALPSKLKDNYPWEFLFDPLNINAIFERDHVGTFLGSSYLYLNTDDLLKIGLLIMNNGIFQDKQIISKSYLNYATGLNEAQGIHGNCDHSSGMTYGAMFWLNRPCKDRDINFKDVPADLIMLLGYGGQNIFIFPSEKIVAVRVAQDKRENGIKLARDEYSRQILKAVKAWRNKDSESEK